MLHLLRLHMLWTTMLAATVFSMHVHRLVAFLAQLAGNSAPGYILAVLLFFIFGLQYGLLFITADVYVLITSIEMLMSREDADSVVREQKMHKCEKCLQMLKRLYFYNQRIRQLHHQAGRNHGAATASLHGHGHPILAHSSSMPVQHSGASGLGTGLPAAGPASLHRSDTVHGRLERQASRIAVSEEDKAALKELHELFDLFDDDKSGNLNYDEVRRLLRSMGNTLTEQELGEVISLMDTNNDGEISLDELSAVMLHQQRSETVKLGEVAEELFAAFDVKGNLQIDRSEVMGVYAQLKGRAAAGTVTSLTDEALVSKGMLSVEEVKEVDEFFDLLDKDGSGVVSQLEFVVFVHEMEAVMRA